MGSPRLPPEPNMIDPIDRSDGLPPPAPQRTPPRPPAADWFSTEDLNAGLGRRTARGGVVVLAGTTINAVTTLVGTVLVTRNLTDEDFGLYGMAIVLTGFAGIFVDLGLGRAVVQRPRVTHRQVSTLFWINVALSTAIATGTAALTPTVVAVFDEPRLATINLVLCWTFVGSALAMQHRALLMRRQRHAAIAGVSIAAGFIGATVSVVAAWLGLGYWALVALPIAGQLATIAGSWAVCHWVPGRPSFDRATLEMIGFGGHVTGVQIINYFAQSADNAMLGFSWGAGPLGLYTRAYSLMMLPATRLSGPLSGVLVPALARLTDQPSRFARVFLLALSTFAMASTMVVGWMVVAASDLVRVLLGEQWLPMLPVFYALSPACLMGATASCNGWLYLSIGHVSRQTRWVMIQTSIMLAVMAAGVQWGGFGLAVSVSAAALLLKPLAIIWSCQGTCVRAADTLRAAYFPILPAALAAAAAVTTRDALAGPGGHVLGLIASTAAYLLGWALWLGLTRRGRRTLDSAAAAVTLLR